MLNKISFNKTVIGLISAAIFSVVFFWLIASNQAGATQVEPCDNETTYTKNNDFSDSKVNINYENSDEQIDVSAGAGYIVIKVELDVDNDNQNGFYTYATGPLNNFNPNPGDDIDNAKVTVKKVCATPTPSPTPTVTPTPSPTPTVTPSVTPSPTPGDEKKINICHATDSQSNPWEAIRVNDDGFWNGHDQHPTDFLYFGPVNEQNDQPLKPEGDEWCENPPTPTPSPTTEPTATPTPTTTTTNGGTGGGTVAGTSTEPTKSVLGLSSTSSDSGQNKELMLLFASFILLAVGARLTIKNA